jgi:hypothetical protein
MIVKSVMLTVTRMLTINRLLTARSSIVGLRGNLRQFGLNFRNLFTLFSAKKAVNHPFASDACA